ncbi:tripartite tricarboxylate transporter TctB family protein [Butyrivibrio sp. WCE2006]|uniref:tripartite tricarboxylate transporter TctB family protein n=1 Tax=Butyrivibrio sp. WCE2006 TaxID=1410611 RepID=UPI0005D136D8|nr:tripartite tricarboxylate transporter TctB family protein [Butyrivibrio sp. WCE2006]
MRRKVVYKSTAIRAVIIFFAIIAILSVFPLRIWQRTITERGGGEIVQTSDRINDYHDVVQKFIAQYDRLESIDIYLEDVELGNYMSMVFYNENMEQIYQRFVYLRDASLPGYINVRVGLDLNVGETYTMIINGAFSTFYVAFEHSGEDTSPYFVSFAYHDTTVEGLQLAAGYNYRQPVTKSMSLLIIAGIILVAALLIIIEKLTDRERRNKLVTVHQVVKTVGNPIAAIGTLAMMILIYPLKYFDQRPLENAFLELGVVIAAVLVFYAINHESDATLDVKLWHNFKNFTQMGLIAAAVWFCCEYMNALYTIYQTLAERKEMIFLLLFLCISIPFSRIKSLRNLIYLIVAGGIGIWYRMGHLVPADEKEYDLKNAALTYGIIIAVLAGFLILNFAAEIYYRTKGREEYLEKRTGFKISVFGILLLVFFAVLIVFRNTRWWGVVLAVFVVGLMVTYALYGFKEYPELILGGLLLNFVVSMGYCWMYRSFAAFNTGRYAFVFHTVTVTAEYMTVMECASAVLLLYKIYTIRDEKSFKARFRYLWKEFILFGFVTAYMIFTISRTSYLACAVMFICMLAITATDCHSGRLRYLGIQVGTMALAVILCFPAAFALQRIFPALVAHPKKFLIETGNFGLYGGGQPDNHLYMNIERFVDLFSEKILGVDIMDYNYPEDIANFNDEGYSTVGENGVPLTEYQSMTMCYSLPEIVASSQTSPEIRQYLLDTGGAELLENMRLEEERLEAERLEAEAAAQEAENASNVEESGEEINSDDLTDAKESSDDTADSQNDENQGSEESSDNAQGTDGIEEFSNGRITIFKSYLQQMTPFGHDDMGAVLPTGEIAIHAHNTYIQVMFDHGILAGIVFLFMMAFAFFAGAKYYVKNRDEVSGALLPFAMTVGFGIAALSEWVFQLSNPMAIALVLSLMPITFKKIK